MLTDGKGSEYSQLRIAPDQRRSFPSIGDFRSPIRNPRRLPTCSLEERSSCPEVNSLDRLER